MFTVFCLLDEQGVDKVGFAGEEINKFIEVESVCSYCLFAKLVQLKIDLQLIDKLLLGSKAFVFPIHEMNLLSYLLF